MYNTMSRNIFGITPEGEEVLEYTLTNANGLELKVITYGCTITSIRIPDRNGVPDNIVLGFDHLEGYLQSKNYIGCVVGRCANRIAYGKFLMDGTEYVLSLNRPPNHLHGGNVGLGNVVWKTKEIQNREGVGIHFNHLSPDGHEGYPGNVNLDVEYFLGNDNSISFTYHASTDRKTILNLTQHSYFNLAGGKENVLDHVLTLHADEFIPVNEAMIPTGEIKPVDHSPFDFRRPKRIGLDIAKEDPQLLLVHGYDQTWVINKQEEGLTHASTLFEPGSGRVIDLFTTEPGIQFYSGNFLEERVRGHQNMKITKRMGLCLETQHYPDSPNQPTFPSVILEPGKMFFSKSVLRFSTLA